MRLVITGAAGFVGINLTKFLLKNKELLSKIDKIVLIDSFQYKGQKFDQELSKNKKFQLIVGSAYDEELANRIFKENDVVIHLATDLNTFDNPQASIQFGFDKYLKVLSDKGVDRFIFISTADVYGINNSDNILETHIVKPTTFYSASKIAFEALLQAHFSLFDFPVIIFRPVTIYGPHQYPGWLVPKVIISAIRNEKIQITGNGSVKRDWVFVDDVCDLIIKAAFSTRKNIFGEVFNIGSGTEETVLEVVNSVFEKLKKNDALIEFVPSRPGEIPRQITKAMKARKTFDWKPKTNFFEGLDKTIDWYLSVNK